MLPLVVSAAFFAMRSAFSAVASGPCSDVPSFASITQGRVNKCERFSSTMDWRELGESITYLWDIGIDGRHSSLAVRDAVEVERAVELGQEGAESRNRGGAWCRRCELVECYLAGKSRLESVLDAIPDPP